ncbi:MAG TPA: lactonase family protein [Terriglobales bacterium]|nr:lactonase family protein [Terriglobales bacterium]
MKLTTFAAAVLLISFLLVTVLYANKASTNYLLFVGTYTKGESKGIYAYRYDAKSGSLTSLGLAAESVNPSFLAVDPSHRFLYAVNEVQDYKGEKSGAVTAFAIDRKTGQLSRLNEVASRGEDPCYISLDKTGKYVLVANYTSGNIAVFPVHNDGTLGEASAFVQHHGSGPNHEHQEGPHAHWIETTADNHYAVVADLGLDKLLIYRFDATNGSLTPNNPPAADLPPGSGPRHVAFSPHNKFAYSVNELKSTVTAFSFNAGQGTLQPFQTVSTLPKDFSGENDTAEIHIQADGKFLYASNRGHDSIAVFSIDQKTGRLNLVNNFSTEGKTPRNFELDPTGSHLLVANEDTGNIVVIKLDGTTGRESLVTNDTVKLPSPVSLRFVPAE